MKNVVIIISAFICLSLAPKLSLAESFFGTFDVFGGGGLRAGKDDRADRIAQGYVGLKLSHTEFQFAGKNRVSILSPGINFQTDAIFSFSLSPITIVIPNRLTIGFDYFPSTEKTSGGPFGIFIGIPLGSN